jgi:Tat protein secretion system quality control protein TatD with DNase activity
VAEQIAEIRGMAVEELAEVTMRNAIRLFKLENVIHFARKED